MSWPIATASSVALDMESKPEKVFRYGLLDANAPMPAPGSRFTRMRIIDRETREVFVDKAIDVVVPLREDRCPHCEGSGRPPSLTAAERRRLWGLRWPG